MAKYLYKLGYWSAENRKKAFLGTFGLLIVAAILTLSMGVSFKEEMTIPGTKSEEAGKVLQKEFPSPSDAGGQVQLVMKAPNNDTLDSEQSMKVIADMLKKIQGDTQVAAVATPVELGNLNEDQTIGYATITYTQPADKVTEASKENVLESIEIARDEGIQTELAGDVVFSELEIGGMTEVLGVAVAYLILALTFTSFLAAGMPILSAVIGLGIGLLVVTAGTNFLDIPTFALSLAAMLGLAVGIDYALFIISRFRQQLTKGDSVKEAVAIATGTAGSAVVFAGMTVIVALLGLATAGVPFLTMMGISAAVCVLIAIFIAIVLVPAILGAFGHKMGPSRKNTFLQKLSRSDKKENGYDKWGRFVTKRPLLITVFGVAILAVLAVPFFHMQLGLPNNGTKSDETTERRAYDLLAEAYGAGYHAPLVIVAEKTRSDVDTEEALEYTTNELTSLENVKSVSPAMPNASGDVFMMSLTPETGPDDIETTELVKAMRVKMENIANQSGLNIMVTGATAVNIDISEKLNDSLPKFALLIVGFAFVLLMMVFRSILVPLKAVLGFLLSLGATLGFVVFVIQDGNLIELFGFPTASPVLSFLPVIVIGILFGLAMDYEVFLVSRMREEFTRTSNAKQAILTGMKESGGVVTAAGLIMVAVFMGFMLAHDPIIKSMGFALTFGVLFDAFIVRMTIVPAVMALMGNSAWYLPKWLDRILPNIDIEGESILHDWEVKKEKDKVKTNQVAEN